MKDWDILRLDSKPHPLHIPNVEFHQKRFYGHSLWIERSHHLVRELTMVSTY